MRFGQFKLLLNLLQGDIIDQYFIGLEETAEQGQEHFENNVVVLVVLLELSNWVRYFPQKYPELLQGLNFQNLFKIIFDLLHQIFKELVGFPGVLCFH